ncbi:hypothetical protein HID58_003140 [Brassica napus]|uniref:Uncharacterized protein n=1 Tax=Brassica napus TaxID=3708 RepID=A0ABQ8EPX1_BRANA|nr:hypothetical protein HID58_003140 [Brassica napus]
MILGLTMHCIKRLRRKMWSVHEIYSRTTLRLSSSWET